MLAGTYLAKDDELNEAELYYTKKETDLYFEAVDPQAANPGYDEYQMNIGELDHNPYELMAYLNARFNEFTFDEIKTELDAIFAQQYRLWTGVKIEIRTREIEKTDPDTGETYMDEEEYEYKIFCINITSNLLSGILIPQMSDAEKQMYDTYMLTRGNCFYFSPPFDDFSWTQYVSDRYGYRVHPIDGSKDFHKAVDIAVPSGTPIKAVQHGVVTIAGWHDSYGNYAIIEDNDEGLKSLYAHCSSLSVSTGQIIKRGDIVGTVGSTGDSTGDHLHLEVYHDNHYFSCGNNRTSKTLGPESHHIRVDTIMEATRQMIARVTQFARDYEDEFVKIVVSEKYKLIQLEQERNRKELGRMTGRQAELEILFTKLYEDRTLGVLPENVFLKMSKQYTKKTADIDYQVTELKKKVDNDDEHKMNVNKFLKMVRKYTTVNEISPEIVRHFIDKIVVHHRIEDKNSKTQKVDFCFNFIGKVEMPMLHELSKYKKALIEKKKTIQPKPYDFLSVLKRTILS